MGCVSAKEKPDKNDDNEEVAPSKPPKAAKEGSSQTTSSPPPAAASSGGKKKSRVEEDEENFILFEPIRNKYNLGDEIGKGGFSIVYHADKKKGGEEFAVKKIEKKKVEGDDIKLLRREIQIMKKLNHANILKLFEVYEDDDSFYLVMELVKGKELFDKIVERGMYSERDAANIIAQVVSAVDYLHENGIAHRDLKPENLLVEGEEEDSIVKIADFGFAKSFGGDTGEKLMTSCGSPGYVAPEILTAESYDKSVDMWSVGVILYILLSGYPPFYADSAPALFKKIMDVKYDFDDSVWDDISDSAKDLIRNLLVKDPSKRFTAQQCLTHAWITGKAKTKQTLKMKKVPDK